MKMTLDLPDELIMELKIRAGIEKRTVKDIVIEFFRQGLGLSPLALKKHRPASAMVVMDDEGLPIIRCRPHAPATRMSPAELLTLEQEAQTEEDLRRAGFLV
ncbi:MAG: Antitoxin VapB41 [Verrucomicrobiales bacterium]|nr:Antitoxin VapB41 [Verrucomicrobiales bacterium]